MRSEVSVMYDENSDLRSFGRRRGRKLHTRPQHLVDTLLPSLMLEPTVDIPAVQGDKRALWLEIGFGGGEHLLQLAKAHPDVMMIGAEPFMNGVAKLLAGIQKNYQVKLPPEQVRGGEAVGSGAALAPACVAQNINIRIVPDDVRPILKALPDASLERVYLLFPDPWPKRKQQKRRILNHVLLDEIARVLPAGGILQLATDHYDYSVWMLEHVLARPEFMWQAESVRDWHEPPAHWVLTKYETKTRAEGRQPVYLRFIRKP